MGLCQYSCAIPMFNNYWTRLSKFCDSLIYYLPQIHLGTMHEQTIIWRQLFARQIVGLITGDTMMQVWLTFVCVTQSCALCILFRSGFLFELYSMFTISMQKSDIKKCLILDHVGFPHNISVSKFPFYILTLLGLLEYGKC